jgi:long-chain acyl-CoA synthetase
MPTRAEIIAELTASGPFELAEERGEVEPPLRVYRNAPPSLRAVLEGTRAHGDKPFILYANETLTFSGHLRAVAGLARSLLAAGVAKGDRVALGMRNYPEWSVSFWACQAVGAIVVALNAWWTTEELAYALQDSGPAALLIDGERLERLRPLLPGLDLRLVAVTWRGGGGDEGIDFADLTRSDDDRLPDIDVGPHDLATILYTSGTTGHPKGAMATHRNHVTNLMNSTLNGTVARVLAGVPADAPPDPAAPQPGMLQTFPFFHIGGLSGLLGGLAGGLKLAVMYRWNAAEAVDIIERHQLTAVAGVPIVVRQLLETASSLGRPLDTLLGVTSGGAPVPPDLIRRIGEQFEARAAPGNGYGLTETTSAVIMNSGADYLAHPDSVGRPMATADIRIVGEGGQDVGVGEIGELWVRGPNVIPGYWNNLTATEAAFGGGWFRTGDLGYVDAEGLYYVVDRLKDVIIRGGENVYCAEVEAALLERPGIKDAAVVGLPDAAYGEVVGAVIQVAPGADAAALQAELTDALAAKLARFKIPSAWRFTQEELPRTATGKVLKRELRGRFEATAG